MPMETRLERSGHDVKLKWGYFHLESLSASMKDEGLPTKRPEDGSNYIYCGFPNDCRYTFKDYHEFTDPVDGEVFQIFPGDIYHASR